MDFYLTSVSVIDVYKKHEFAEKIGNLLVN